MNRKRQPHTTELRRNCLLELLERRQLLSIALPITIPSGGATSPGISVGKNTHNITPSVSLSDQDIGSPAVAGSLAVSNGTFTVVGGGADIGGTSDQFNFASTNYSGDGSIVARLNMQSVSDAGAKAGLMIRKSALANSAFAGIFITPFSGLMFVTRGADGGSAVTTTVFGPHTPQYLRLSRSGSSVSGYYSSDGATWTQVGANQSISLATSASFGLAVCAHNNASSSTCSFTNVSALLQNGWGNFDVGSPGFPGSAAYDSASNSYNFEGSGADIGGTSDQFNFTSRGLIGDGSVTALVNSITNTNASAKAGVMIRDTSAVDAAFAGDFLTPQNGVIFEWRATSGAAASSVAIPAISGPVWLRVGLQGSNFSAYYSSDGATWTQIGSTQSIAMSSALSLAGMAVSSHDNSSLATASFSSVSLVRGGWTDGDIGAPALGGSAVYDAPSDTYTLIGSGTGFDASLQRSRLTPIVPDGPKPGVVAADQFNFAGTVLSGDGVVMAYLDSITNASASAKAGVMIRSDNSTSAAFAGAFVSASNALVFEWRPSAGGGVQQITAAGSFSAPISMKVTRSGSAFQGFYSTDGINWIAIGGTQSATIATSALGGIAVSANTSGALCTANFSSTYVGNAPPPAAGLYSASDQSFLNDLQNRELLYFYNESNASTGLTPDSSNANGGSDSAFASIAAIGFDLTALTIADQRGWLTHAQAYNRALTTVNFLFNSGANWNGFLYHFLNPATGARYGTSEVSSVDNAELMSGVLNVAQYWSGTALQTSAQNLFNRVNWPFMQRSNGQFYGAYTPESGLSGDYGDFSEAALLYMLAMGSPTFPATQASWNSWSRSPHVSYSGFNFVTADDAALFTVQWPQAWFDLRGLSDSTGLNYYNNAATATLAQRQWMTDLSSTYSDYGPNMWGLTPSDSANGYTVWGGPPANGPINGTVVPTGPGGSLEFTPRRSIDALEYMATTYATNAYKKYGLIDAFNPLTNWNSSLVLGIDIGMMIVSAENARSSFVWNTFNQQANAQQSLAKAFPTSAKSAWLLNGSGNWNATASWNNATIPNGIGKEADFLGAIPGGRTIFSDTAIITGTLNFNSPNTYVLSGAGVLTLQVSSGSALVNVQQGTQEINLPLTIASNTIFNVAAGATLIIADPVTILPGATITTTGGGTVTYESTSTPQSFGTANFAPPSPNSFSHVNIGGDTHDLFDDLFVSDALL